MSQSTISLSPIDVEKQRFEAQVSVAWTPGDLLIIDTLKTKRHATAAGAARKMFGLESPSKGGTIDTDTVADERAPYMIGRAGDLVYAWIADAVETVDGVTLLISNGDGSLKVALGDELDTDIVGTARTTATASGKTRCIIECS